jgi:hypothetical protein
MRLQEAAISETNFGDVPSLSSESGGDASTRYRFDRE